MSISKENKATYAREKRIKELNSRGYRPENIAAMMHTGPNSISTKEIQKAIKNPHVKLDGKV